jgi:membrane protein DedA with SNARE-associated domain
MTLDATQLPLAQAIAFLFVVAMVRANATYWVGRGVLGGVARTRLSHRLDGPTMRHASRFMARWGVFAVPLSFLTIGVQTAVNATAGLTRVPLSRYLPAVTVGALIWAVVYATVGLAAFYAAVALAIRSPWAAAVLGVGAVGLAGWLLWRRATRRHVQAAVEPAVPRD